MKTYLAKVGEIKPECLLFDASEMPVGRLAVRIANALRGKDKPTYTPHVDTGDYVIVINTDKLILTGKKMEQKYYYHHSGYIGGMKAVQAKTMMATKPERAVELAIKGMLPKNTLGAQAFTRLKVYAGDAHKHEAQKPEAYEF